MGTFFNIYCPGPNFTITNMPDRRKPPPPVPPMALTDYGMRCGRAAWYKALGLISPPWPPTRGGPR